jgi:glycine dehydrogenase subunit 1
MRYLPLSDADRQFMLAEIGVTSVDELFAGVPEGLLLDDLVDLPRRASEMQVERQLSRLAARNITAGSVPFFCGAGAYRHHVPASVDHLIQRSEFLTSYTPYQPEITQGTLQYLFEFQTQVAELTGMDVANASMYDGSTATAEAVMMAHRITRRKKALLAGGLHPHYRSVVETVSDMAGFEVKAMPADVKGDADLIVQLEDDLSCVVIQMPSFYGHVFDYSKLAKAAKDRGILVIAVFNEVVSLGLLKSPGSMGADIVVGEGQSLGNGLNFGGPYVGLMATRQKYIRQMPGRICGETVDSDGKRGFVLTLSTREQHIRRDKATSNICTNSGLCCLSFTIHMSLLGGHGLQKLARANHARAVQLAERINALNGFDVLNDAFFNEMTVRVPGDAARLVDQLAEKNILAGVPVSRLERGKGLDDLLLLTVTEMTSDEDIEVLVKGLISYI